jgi:hypothetical protein
MPLKKILLSLLAGSLFISSTGCTTEQINLVANLANQFLQELESGNRASIDLKLVSDSGQYNSVSVNDVDDVRIGGRRVKYSFNASGELVIEDFNLSDGAQAEAEVYLRGYKRPVIVVINPENQKRNNIRLSAQATVSNVAQNNVILDQRATITTLAKRDDLQEFLRNSVDFNLGSRASSQLRGKEIMGVWLDGDRMSQNQFRVNTNGHILMQTSAFLRFFMGLDAKGNFLQSDDNLATVSFRNSNNYKQLKDNLRKKVLREKTKYVQTRVITETRVIVTKKVITEQRFITQQVRTIPLINQNTANIRINLQVSLNRLDAQKRAEIEKKAQEQRLAAAERQKLEQRLAELKQREAELNARQPQTNVQVVRVGNKILDRRQLASIRGLAATKLARDNQVYKNRTLYVLTRTSKGTMQLYKFIISGKNIESVAQRLGQHLTLAKQRAAQARQRLVNVRSSVDVDNLLNEVSAEVDTLSNLNQAGDLVCEAQAENLQSNSNDELSIEIAALANVSQTIMKEEIETELSEELSDVLVDITGSSDDVLGIDLLASDITQAAEEAQVSALPQEEVITEDQINLETEIEAATQASADVQQSIEASIAEEILIGSFEET